MILHLRLTKSTPSKLLRIRYSPYLARLSCSYYDDTPITQNTSSFLRMMIPAGIIPQISSVNQDMHQQDICETHKGFSSVSIAANNHKKIIKEENKTRWCGNSKHVWRCMIYKNSHIFFMRFCPQTAHLPTFIACCIQPVVKFCNFNILVAVWSFHQHTQWRRRFHIIVEITQTTKINSTVDTIQTTNITQTNDITQTTIII